MQETCLVFGSAIMSYKPSAQTLREQLMAPEAIERVRAMHALELEVDEVPEVELAQELEEFASRGIPYYAPEDPHYREWVGKAVNYWERLQAAPAAAPRLTPRALRRVAAL
jgi:hypothetical protein